MNKFLLALMIICLSAQAASAAVIRSVKSRTVFEGEDILVRVKGRLFSTKNPIQVRFLDFVDGQENEFDSNPSVATITKKSKLLRITAPNVSKNQSLILEVKRQNDTAEAAARTEIFIFNKPDDASPGPAGADGQVDATAVTTGSLKLGEDVTLSSNGDALTYNGETIIHKNADNTRVKVDQADIGNSILENVAGALKWNGHTVAGPDGVINARTLNDGASTATSLSITGTKSIILDSNGLDVNLKLPPRGIVKSMLKAQYDFAADGGVTGNIVMREGLLPANAIITRAWYEVITTLSSASDAAQVSLGIESDDVSGIVAPIAISDVSNPWDLGIHETIQQGQVINFANKTSADKNLHLVITGEALTAGKINLFAEYLISN